MSTTQATASATMAIPMYGATSALRSSKLSSGRGGAESSSRPIDAHSPCRRPGQRGPVYPLPPMAPCPRLPDPSEAPNPAWRNALAAAHDPASASRSRAGPRRRPRPLPPSTAAAAPRPAGLTDAELARAAELEAQLVAEEQAAENARRRTQERSATAREVSATR